MLLNVATAELFVHDKFYQEFIITLLSCAVDIADDLNPFPAIAYKYSDELFKIVNVIESPLAIVNQTLICCIETLDTFESIVTKNKVG